MTGCSILSCRNCTRKGDPNNGHVSFHKFPTDPIIKQKWIAATGRKDWFPTKNSTICSKHFENSFFTKRKKLRLLKSTAYPTLNILRHIDNDDADKDTPQRFSPLSRKRKMIENDDEENDQESQPGPSKRKGSRSSDSNVFKEQDLSIVIEQCRFCGEFSKDCIPVLDNMPYLAGSKTTLSLNGTSLLLDFNDHSLPNTVCRDCDVKLQEICEFINVVKDAQGTLINIAEENRTDSVVAREELEETTAELEDDIETLIVKTEYDSQNEYSDDDKEGIVDSLTVGETVFVKKPVTNKKKDETYPAKPKRLNTKEKCENSESLIEIKEEIIEDANDGHERTDDSDMGTEVKPSEVELATSALMFELAGDGRSTLE